MRTHWPALLAVALIMSGCLSGAVVRVDSPGNVPPKDISTFISLPTLCFDLAFADDVLWAIHRKGLSRIDPATNRVIETISTPDRFGLIAVDGDAVWLSSGLGALESHELLRIDTRTKQVVARIPGLVGALAAGEGAVWVTKGFTRPGSRPDSVVRIDRKTNAVVATIYVGKSPVAVAVGAGGVWVLQTDGSIIQIDPQTNQVVAKTGIGEEVLGDSDITVGAGAVWVANRKNSTVSRIDPVTHRTVANIPVGGSDFRIRIRASGDGVWVSSGTVAGTARQVFWIAKIDPTTNQRVWAIQSGGGRGGLGNPFHALAVGAGAVWTCAFSRE